MMVVVSCLHFALPWHDRGVMMRLSAHPNGTRKIAYSRPQIAREQNQRGEN
jgi:hypothetical protein